MSTSVIEIETNWSNETEEMISKNDLLQQPWYDVWPNPHQNITKQGGNRVEARQKMKKLWSSELKNLYGNGNCQAERLWKAT